MEIAQINQRIAVLNADSKRINNDRAVSIGKKETLQKQMNDALAAYKEKYGVELTEANLQSEIDRVSAEKLKEVEQIEAVLNLIKLGQYDEANALVNGTPAKEESVPVKETPVAPVAPVVEQLVETAKPVQESIPTPPDLGIPTPPVQESIPTPPDLGIPTPPIQESIPTPPDLGTPAESIPTPPVLGSPVESIPTPPDLGIPTPPVEPSLGVPPVAPTSTPSGQPIASFNAILGGSPFKPQGEV